MIRILITLLLIQMHQIQPKLNEKMKLPLKLQQTPQRKQKKKLKGKGRPASSIVKEVRVRPKIDTHDLEIKIRKAREFLEEGHKVQATCLFRGREMAYQELGKLVLDRFAEALEEIAKVEGFPRMEGRRMHMKLTRR